MRTESLLRHCGRWPNLFQACADCGMLTCPGCIAEHWRHQCRNRLKVRSFQSMGTSGVGIVGAIHKLCGEERPLTAFTTREEWEACNMTRKGVPKAIVGEAGKEEVMAAAWESNRKDAGRSSSTAEGDVRKIGRVVEQAAQTACSRDGPSLGVWKTEDNDGKLQSSVL